MIFSPDRKERAFELLDAFFRWGGNLIDTAEIYGRAEETIGMWLAERGNRADVVILDKGCHPPTRITPETIRKSIRVNLARLGTDYLDIWAMHRDDLEAPVEMIVDTLNEEVARGRIRAYGGSNFTMARIAKANAYAARKGLIGMAISSPHLSLAVPKEPFWEGCTYATEEEIRWHEKTGIPLVAWSSQGRGFFRDDSSPQNTSNPDLVRVYHNEENFERLARARELAKEKGVTATQIALAYVLNLHIPTIALVGPENVAEVESCVHATEISLSQEELDWLTLKIARRI